MKKPNARDRLMVAASELFTEKGYSSVGINEIIRRSETAKASFYHHFPSKDDLCVAWLSDTHERSITQLEAILASDLPPMDKIEGYFEDLRVWLEEKSYRGCPYTNTAAGLNHSSETILKQVDQHKETVRRFFVQLARQLGHEGDAVETIGNGLFLLYSGATIEAQNLRALWPVEAAIKAARDLSRHAAPMTEVES